MANVKKFQPQVFLAQFTDYLNSQLFYGRCTIDMRFRLAKVALRMRKASKVVLMVKGSDDFSAEELEVPRVSPDISRDRLPEGIAKDFAEKVINHLNRYYYKLDLADGCTEEQEFYCEAFISAANVPNAVQELWPLYAKRYHFPSS